MHSALRWTPYLALAVAAGSATAQSPSIADEGSFTITVGGRTVGRENFRISMIRRGDAVDFLAKADIALGDQRISPELVSDSTGAALQYTVRRSGDGNTTWRGTIVRNRLSATITSERGPAAREFIVPPGTLVLDDDVLHQLFLVARRTHNGRVPVVIPHRNDQAAAMVSTIGTEQLLVGTTEMTATHLRIRQAGTDTREVWVDQANRVLKVEIPSRRLTATRDDPPRR